MGICLVFHGGLFQLLPGSGSCRRVDVHFALPEPVRVVGTRRGSRTRWEELEAAMGSAARIDFAVPRALRPEHMPVRSVSHLLPVDYQGFRKTIGFTGGVVSGMGPRVPSAEVRGLREVKGRGRSQEMRAAFASFTGVSSHREEDLDPLAHDFFSRLDKEELRRWKPGYRVSVTLPVRGVRILLNGRPQSAQELQDGLRIEFRAASGSVIPHFPAHNPHVMEQPPTG